MQRIQNMHVTFKSTCVYPFMSFCLISGPIPSVEAQTKAQFSLSKLISRSCWSATAEMTSDSTVSLTMCSHPNAPIGVYKLILDQGEGVGLGDFVLLFNPWCKSKLFYH